LAEASFWQWAGKTALNVVTLGATGRVDAVRGEAEAADKAYRAAYQQIENLQSRAKSLAEERGEATRKAHADLQNLVNLLTALGRATGFQSGSVKNQCDLAIAKIQKTIVDFNVAVELVTASGAGAVTTAGAWAVVSALGVASTGTAIGGLSGAAASHAALAWFGGGSLATGGGGMALGSVVLGGLVILPLIGVAAWLGHRAADKKIAEIRPEIEKTQRETQRLRLLADRIRAECDRVNGIVTRTNSLREDLATTMSELQRQIEKLQATGTNLAGVMNEPGFNFPSNAA
jgi:hypothetical protein